MIFNVTFSVSFVRRPTNAQGNSGFFIINTFQILSRYVSAYGCHPQGSWVPYKLPKPCSVLWTGHNSHTSITQNTAWVAYKALATPWGWQPYAETCRGRIWNVLMKHPLLPWVFVGLFTNDTTRCSVLPSRMFTLVTGKREPSLRSKSQWRLENAERQCLGELEAVTCWE
jgi:hypothetical protein